MAIKCLRALSDLFSPNLIDQSLCRILTTHTKTRPILLDYWPIRLGENIPYQSSQTFGGYLLYGYSWCYRFSLSFPSILCYDLSFDKRTIQKKE